MAACVVPPRSLLFDIFRALLLISLVVRAVVQRGCSELRLQLEGTEHANARPVPLGQRCPPLQPEPQQFCPPGRTTTRATPSPHPP
eukprot:COSAG04_NODE_16711_length_491_cov_1.081633_1_plen_85_part_10